MSSLFANQRETSLASTVALVEQALRELELAEVASELSVPGASRAWQITKGSAVTRVTVVGTRDLLHLRVAAVVMTLDDQVDRAALYGHLLEQNAHLCGAAFAADGDRVLLVSERSTLDLDQSEVTGTIDRVATYADEHDDALVARFGGTIGAA